MKLLIDTSNSEKVIVSVDGDRVVEDATLEKAQKLLHVIDKLLKKKGVKISDVTSVEVNTGPGSFTGLRVGISVANTLGWALGVSVNGRDVRESPIEPQYK